MTKEQLLAEAEKKKQKRQELEAVPEGKVGCLLFLPAYILFQNLCLLAESYEPQLWHPGIVIRTPDLQVGLLGDGHNASQKPCTLNPCKGWGCQLKVVHSFWLQ